MSASSGPFRWLGRWLQRGWLSLLLLGGIYLVTAGSIANAKWVPVSDPILVALALGMILGAALAYSRWPGWLALVYTLLLAPLLSCQAVGQIFPSLDVVFSLRFFPLLDLMNVRIFAFFARLGGWVSTYQSGQTIQDNGLFVLLACLLVWLLGAWLTWCVQRRQAVLGGLLPLAILMAVNVNLAGEDVTFLVIYLALGMLLLAQGAHRRQHIDWERRKLDYPEDLGLDWAASAAVVVLVVALAARLAPVFGTAEGWKAVSDLFKPMQQQVQDTAARIFGQVNPPRVSPEPALVAETPQLGLVGAPPAQGNEVIFWVTTSDPAPPPPEAGPSAQLSRPQHYWRSQIYATYTGRGWDEAPLSTAAYVPPALASVYDPATHTSTVPVPPGRYLLTQTFEMEARHGVALFAASQPVQAISKALPGESGSPLVVRAIQPDGSTLLQATPAALAATGDHIASYTVTSLATQVTADQLSAAGSNYPLDIRSAYLQLPDSLPQRVRDLAARLAQDASNPYEVAMRIQSYLRITYAYTLDVKPPPAGRDVADYFLFEAPGGFCSYYATAMAVMLRTQGIPARVATGYATGDYDYSRRAYAVTAGSAHAWVEVYFPGFDWVEFEPTASQTPFAYAGLAQAVPGTTPAPAAGPTSLPPAVTTILLGLGMAGGIALLVLLLRFLGAGPRPGPKVDANLLALSHYFYVRRALRQAGVAAASSTTPDEFLAQAGPRLSQRRGLSNALRQATRVYEEAAFSPRPPALRQVETARRAWAGSFWEWLRLAGGNLIKSTTSRSSPQRRRGHRGFTEKKNIKV